MKLGDRVRRVDADEPASIPAYRNMTGTVVEVHPLFGGLVRVHWDCDSYREPAHRKTTTLKVVPFEECGE